MATSRMCMIDGDMVDLPDGVGTVDLRTAEGMLSYLRFDTEPCIKFVKTLRDPILRRQRVFSHGSIRTLRNIAFALCEEHPSKITRREYETVVAYFEEVWDELQSNQQWIETGTLDEVHQELLMCHVSWARLPLFVKLFMPRGFPRLARFFRASKVHFPCPYVSEHFLLIINNARITLHNMTMTEAQALDMVDLMDDHLNRLVKTGVVAQVLRALTAPVCFNKISGYLDFVQCIMRDETLTRKRFSPSTPCGKVLEALLGGTDGWKPGSGEQGNPDSPVVLERLKALQKRSMTEISPTQSLLACYKCDKVVTSVKKCGRCKKTTYCSRECQKADWKEHKKFCRSGERGVSTAMPQELCHFLSTDYVEIMTEVSRVTRSRGIAKKDVVVVVDMKMEHPAIIATPYAHLVDGESDVMTDWCTYCMEIPDILASLQRKHRHMTSNHLLFLYRNGLSDVSVWRTQFRLISTGLQLFSDEVLSKFPLSDPDEASAVLARGGPESILWAHRSFGPSDAVVSSSETTGRQG